MTVLQDLTARKVMLQRWLKARENVPAYAENVREIKAELVRIEQELQTVDG